MRCTLVSVLAIAACTHSASPRAGVPANTAAAPAAPMTPASKHSAHDMMCDKDLGCGVGSLVIDEHADGSIGTTIQVSGGGDHTCEFEGTLVPDQQEKIPPSWHYEGNAEDGPCHIDLTLLKDRYVLNADGCRYYCGARAALWGEFAL